MRDGQCAMRSESFRVASPLGWRVIDGKSDRPLKNKQFDTNYHTKNIFFYPTYYESNY